MKKFILVICFLVMASLAFAEDSKETLTLRRDLAQERVLRIKSELELIKSQYREGQEALKTASGDLDKLNTSLKSLDEPAKVKDMK